MASLLPRYHRSMTLTTAMHRTLVPLCEGKGTMKISLHSVFVDDQDKTLTFYTDKKGNCL